MDNSETTYAVGSVTGIAPAGGGPMDSGAGVGGIIL